MPPWPKPELRPKVRKPMKRYNAKRQGSRFPKRRDRAFIAWIHEFPCAICVAMGHQQITPTEAEHLVERARGGYDKGDVFPTCGEHRELRHVQWGPKTFERRMLDHFGLDLKALCARLAQQYDLGRIYARRTAKESP